MPIICEPVDNVKESAKYMSDKEFVHAYPKPNPNTPLGSSWQFAPCFLPKKRCVLYNLSEIRIELEPANDLVA
ncbi:hypothetical protein HA402_007637 [Bradysia odoriphaga]|nr:hypothetical protein HA402_007637 [Bradysia odoriphaga]